VTSGQRWVASDYPAPVGHHEHHAQVIQNPFSSARERRQKLPNLGFRLPADSRRLDVMPLDALLDERLLHLLV
jgi:hypothetical protein